MYNEINDIEQTVQHCIRQKAGKYTWEIVLIDDCSIDGTYEFCYKMFSTYSNIQILHNTVNKGVSYSRNCGVNAATGDVMIFLNSDELVDADFIERIDQHYNKNADYIFPLSRVHNRDSLYGCFRDCYRLKKYNRPNLFMWSQGFSCKKECFMKVGGFDIRYPGCGGEDWDFVSKLDLLYLNRVVDWNITVQHTVPEKLRDILWHIFNRGRGSAFYDFIYKKKDPIKHLLKKFASILILIGLGLLLNWTLVISYLVYSFCKLVLDAYRMQKGYESQRCSIVVFYILDKLIRNVGYDINAFLHIIRGIHYD